MKFALCAMSATPPTVWPGVPGPMQTIALARAHHPAILLVMCSQTMRDNTANIHLRTASISSDESGFGTVSTLRNAVLVGNRTVLGSCIRSEFRHPRRKMSVDDVRAGG